MFSNLSDYLNPERFCNRDTGFYYETNFLGLCKSFDFFFSFLQFSSTMIMKNKHWKWKDIKNATKSHYTMKLKDSMMPGLKLSFEKDFLSKCSKDSNSVLR